MKLAGKHGSGAARSNAQLTRRLRGLGADAYLQIDARSVTAYRVDTSQIDGELNVQQKRFGEGCAARE
jgi:hypothetical protein